MGAPTSVRHEIINPGGGQTRVPGPVGVDPDDGHLLTDHARNDQLAAIGPPAGPAFELRIGRECHESAHTRAPEISPGAAVSQPTIWEGRSMLRPYDLPLESKAAGSIQSCVAARDCSRWRDVPCGAGPVCGDGPIRHIEPTHGIESHGAWPDQSCVAAGDNGRGGGVPR